MWSRISAMDMARPFARAEPQQRGYLRAVNGSDNLVMARITRAELRAKMTKYLDSIESSGEELIVTRRNREPLVILPLAQLRGMRETLHLLSFPASAGHLLRSIALLNEGRGTERT